MRTRNLKALAEDREGEYEEWVEERLKEGANINEIMDIYDWLLMEELTAEEARNDQIRDDKLTGDYDG